MTLSLQWPFINNFKHIISQFSSLSAGIRVSEWWLKQYFATSLVHQVEIYSFFDLVKAKSSLDRGRKVSRVERKGA